MNLKSRLNFSFARILTELLSVVSVIYLSR
jgi:hypothetical protein